VASSDDVQAMAGSAGDGDVSSAVDRRSAMLLVELINESSPQDSLRFLQSHEELLGEAADVTLQQLVAIAESAGRRHEVVSFKATRRMLARSRQVGPEQALSEAIAAKKAAIELASTTTLAEQSQFVKSHPEVLEQEVDGVLADLMATFEAMNDPQRAMSIAYRRTFLRRCRRDGVAAAAAAVDDKSAPLRGAALKALLTQPSWAEAQRFLENHPELLDGETELALAQLIDVATARGDANGLEAFEQHRFLLRRSREVGVESAFRFLTDPLTLLNELDRQPSSSALRRFLEDHPELIQEAFLRTLTELARISRSEGHAGNADRLESMRSLLRLSREVGAAAAVDRITPPTEGSHGHRELEKNKGVHSDASGTSDGPPASEGTLPDDGHSASIVRPPTETEIRVLIEVVGKSYVAWSQGTSPREFLLSVHASRQLLTHPELAQLPSDVRTYAINIAANTCVRASETLGSEDDLNTAIAAWQEYLPVVAADDRNRAGYLGSLAIALSIRHLRHGSRSDLDASIELTNAALALTGPREPNRSVYLNNLGNALTYRYRLLGDIGDLDASLDAWTEAIRQLPDEHPAQTMHYANRGDGFVDRYTRSHDAADLEKGLADSQSALSRTSADDPSRASYLSNHANGLAMRFALFGDIKDLNTAIDEASTAVGLTARGNRALPPMLVSLAQRLLDRYARTKQAPDLRAALTQARAADALVQDDNPHRPAIVVVLADCLARACQLPDSEIAPDDAVTAYREACVRGLRSHPDAAVKSAREWSQWAAERHAWREVAEAAEYGLRAMDMLVRVQGFRQDKESRLRDVRGLGTLGAYAYAKLGDTERAAVVVERGRGVLLADSLAVRTTLNRLGSTGHKDLVDAYQAAANLRAVDSQQEPEGTTPTGSVHGRPGLEPAISAIRAVPGFEDFLARPSDNDLRSQIAEAASVDPIVYVLYAAAGGMLIVVDGEGNAEPVDLPGLSDEAVRDHVMGYITALASFRQQHRVTPDLRAALDNTTRWLWDVAGSPLSAHLERRGLHSAVLVTTGVLGILPFHAAWGAAPNEQGRHYVTDGVTISYAPNARSILSAHAFSDRQANSILAIDEPRPVQAAPLPASALEVAYAVATFDRKTVLRHEKATKSDVLGSLRDQDVVHFSCHGLVQPSDPLTSCLVMAGDEPLTVADLLATRLEQARLVVLSACDSALIGGELDEVVGLPTALLQAGAVAAVGSLWSVEDLATMVLMREFYRLWRVEGRRPADALCQAQRWMRNLTTSERASAFPGVDFAGSGDASPRPYANPFWWAAFGLTGV